MQFSIKYVTTATISLLVGVGVTTLYFKNIAHQQETLLLSLKETKKSTTNLSSQFQPSSEETSILNPSRALKIALENKVKALSSALENAETQMASQKAILAKLQNNQGPGSLSPSFVKSTLIPLQVKPVVNHLSSLLKLSEDDSEQLNILLQKKAEADTDATMAYMSNMNSYEVGDQSKMQQASAEVESILANNQNDYESELNNILTTQQLDEYRAYETAKLQQKQKFANDFKVNELHIAVKDLNDYQQQQLSTLFVSNGNLENSPVSLGVSGSPYAKQRNFMQTQKQVTKQLEYLLTNEQFEQYLEYLKQKS